MGEVLTTAEAEERWGRGHVRNKIAQGVWQRPARGVVVTHNGPLLVEEYERVALCAARKGSALAGQTAARHGGLKGFDTDVVHLVLPEGAKLPKLRGITCHFSTMLERELDVHPIENPRRTTLERSVVDAASWSERPRFARALVLATFQQRLTNTTRMRHALQRRGPCRHRALISQSILDASGGIQSLPERDFAEIWAIAGLPTLSHQERVRATDGHYFLDAHCEELGLGVEVHGIPHSSVLQWDADLFRANEVQIAGPKLLVFSSYAVRHEREVVGRQLAQMARSLGWDGPLPSPEQLARTNLYPSRSPKRPKGIIIRPANDERIA